MGKPLVNMLIDRGATVTCCNSHTDYGYEMQITNNDADVIVSAIGKQNSLIGQILVRIVRLSLMLESTEMMPGNCVEM